MGVTHQKVNCSNLLMCDPEYVNIILPSAIFRRPLRLCFIFLFRDLNIMIIGRGWRLLASLFSD